MKRLVYLHGFLSSPESFKAQTTKAWLQQHRPDIEYLCPALSSYPGQAIETLRNLMAHGNSETMVVGSSLGGYWATWLVAEFAVRAVLINPAVKPSMLQSDYVGVELKSYYSEETYVLGEKDIADMQGVYVETVEHPENIWLLAQKGDETCDYRLAAEKYQGCKQSLQEGGDHSFQGYESWIPDIVDFLENQ